jgi:cyclic beta-1,2-glucan synthetase
MRRINVTYYAEWVLGTTRENTSAYIVPEFVSSHFALLARNTYSTDFGQRVAFLASTVNRMVLLQIEQSFSGIMEIICAPPRWNASA